MQNKIILNENERYIISKAILELSGPLHSPFADHLYDFHNHELEEIEGKLDLGILETHEIRLIVDLLKVFLEETLDIDWGTIYEFINRKDIENLLKKLSCCIE